jgi:uncharacterized short protein YbdD (DUF466 family)
VTARLPVVARHRRSGHGARRRIDLVGRAGRCWRFLRWYVQELSGEGDYRRYLAQFERLGTCAQPLSRREFERRKMAERESTVMNRCC